jgi:hypothetical protein
VKTVSSRAGTGFSGAFSLLIAVVLLLSCSGKVSASCGDYLMPLGQMHHDDPSEPGVDQNRVVFDLFESSPARVPCHGPTCGGAPSKTSFVALPGPPPDTVPYVAGADQESSCIADSGYKLAAPWERVSAVYRAGTILRPPIL